MSGYLIFGGIDSRDYDVFVSFSDIDTVPRRVYTKVDIVGKNGAVLIDEGKYEDVPHSYDCIVLDNEKRVAFVNAIMSKKGYQRLTDSYGTDEYYTAVLEENIEQKTTRIRDKYKFKLVFTRKPQRFLTSGEEPVDTSELGGEVTTDKIPYLFRRSGGGTIGHDFNAEIDKIIGGTVAWNQLAKALNSTNWSTGTGVTASYSDGVVTISSSVANNGIRTPLNIITGHRYLVSFDVKAESGVNVVVGTAVADGISKAFTATTNWENCSYVATAMRTSNTAFYAFARAVYTNLQFRNILLIDLTQAFGTEIADYIYSLEQTTAGAGVAWLKSHGFIDGSYRAYDSGSLQSVKTSEHRTVGFNQWDEETESGCINSDGSMGISATALRSKNFCECLPNTIYHFHKPNTYETTPNICWYDANKTFISRSITSEFPNISSPSNARYFKVSMWNYGTTYNNDICINISDPSKNGQYEPYIAHTYPLDSDLELRGLFKLDANNNLYAEGDVYESSGAVSRKYGIVDLGTLNWAPYVSSDIFTLFYVQISTALIGTGINAICQKYTMIPSSAGWNGLSDKQAIMYYGGGQNRIAVRDASYATAQDFKTAMSGVYLVYELATPTTEQADPYQRIQIADNNGTEEYVDTRDVPVPVGHETKYGMRQLVLNNPTEFPSKPLLEVTGVGTFWLGDTQFTITGTEGQTIYIDCETGEAWKNTGGIITPANGLVTLNRLDFPELDPGDTPVMYGTGITKVVVTPRWWRL